MNNICREIEILSLIEKNPYILIDEVANQLGVSLRTAKSLFKELEESKTIKRINGKRYGYWKILPNSNNQALFRNSVKNDDITLITRDCIGGILYHQLGRKFLSPTINLFLTPTDFNYFCLNLKEYIDAEVVESNDNLEYPVGIISPNGLRPIKVYFMHYDSFDEAKRKWDERKRRINFGNIYVINSFCYPKEVVEYSNELINNWNKIPYKKMVFVDQKYGFNDEYLTQKPARCVEYAWLLYSPSKKAPWKRTFNKFNFIKFLNEKYDNIK